MTNPKVPTRPEGYQTVNPFIITKCAPELIEFLKVVFDGTEIPEARTIDTDGLLLHSEVRIGDSILMIADTKPAWPSTPSLLRVYVDNVERTLERATLRGAEVVTRPTDLFGDLLSRFIDPWDNLWWVYQHTGLPTDWESSAPTEEWGIGGTTPELEYIHRTLLEAMVKLARR